MLPGTSWMPSSQPILCKTTKSRLASLAISQIKRFQMAKSETQSMVLKSIDCKCLSNLQVLSSGLRHAHCITQWEVWSLWFEPLQQKMFFLMEPDDDRLEISLGNASSAKNVRSLDQQALFPWSWRDFSTMTLICKVAFSCIAVTLIIWAISWGKKFMIWLSCLCKGCVRKGKPDGWVRLFRIGPYFWTTQEPGMAVAITFHSPTYRLTFSKQSELCQPCNLSARIEAEPLFEGVFRQVASFKCWQEGLNAIIFINSMESWFESNVTVT